jgi:gluconate kinase
MHPNLLASQFATLEEPKDALWVDASRGPDEIVAALRRQLQV